MDVFFVCVCVRRTHHHLLASHATSSQLPYCDLHDLSVLNEKCENVVEKCIDILFAIGKINTEKREGGSL